MWDGIGHEPLWLTINVTEVKRHIEHTCKNPNKVIYEIVNSRGAPMATQEHLCQWTIFMKVFAPIFDPTPIKDMFQTFLLTRKSSNITVLHGLTILHHYINEISLTKVTNVKRKIFCMLVLTNHYHCRVDTAVECLQMEWDDETNQHW